MNKPIMEDNENKIPSIFCIKYCTVIIRLSGHVCSQSIFPDKRIFWITESPISPDLEIGSHSFCPD